MHPINQLISEFASLIQDTYSDRLRDVGIYVGEVTQIQHENRYSRNIENM